MKKIKDGLCIFVFILGGLFILSSFISEGLSLWGRIRDILFGVALWLSLAFPVVRHIGIFIVFSLITLSNTVQMIIGAAAVDLISIILTITSALLSIYFCTKIIKDFTPLSPLNNSGSDNDLVVSSTEELRAFYDTHALVDTISTNVVGVSFSNSDGSSRQEILSRCSIGDEVYFRFFLYEGKPAYAVITNRGQLGNLPADLAKTIDRKYTGCTFRGLVTELTGGYDGLYYGCNIHISVFRKKQEQPTVKTSSSSSIPAKDIVYPNSRKRNKPKEPSVDSNFIAEAQWYTARGGTDLIDDE